jgi:hypothetical protein
VHGFLKEAEYRQGLCAERGDGGEGPSDEYGAVLRIAAEGSLSYDHSRANCALGDVVGWFDPPPVS